MANKPKTSSEGPQSGESQTDAASAQGRPSSEDYTSTGTTVVKTRRGHRVVPSNTDLPVVDEQGVKMSADNAKAVVGEFPDYAFIEEGE